MRPKQWIKNLFIFLPLIFGAKLFVLSASLKTAAGFCLFSIMSSAVYLINDVIDMDQDKAHPIKRFRSIASGKVTIKQALLLSFMLGVSSIFLTFVLDTYLGVIFVIYGVSNILYSRFLKKVVIIDVFCLAFFFYLRIMAGSMTAGVILSHWIVFMTILLALFLGFNKRRQELQLINDKSNCYRNVLVNYNRYFIDQMISVITSSLVVVYMLYTVDTRTVKEFGTTHLIYTVPFVYYGIFRYLYLIHQLHQDGNPTDMLFSDAKMLINLLLWGIVSVVVIYF